MDILQLRYFSRVYELGNYSHAADALYISRQALRQVIHNMEKEVGEALFLNVRNNLQPTQTAQWLYAESREVIRTYESFEERLGARFTAQREKTICLGLINNIHSIFTHEEISECHRREIPFELTRVSGNCEMLREGVRTGRLDTAILFGSGEEDEAFEVLSFGERKPLYAMVNIRHPLAGRETVRIEDLKGELFISQGRGYDIHRMLEEAAHAAGFSLNIGYAAEDMLSLVSYVQGNKGVSFSLTRLPYHFQSDQVCCIPFEEPGLMWEAYAILRRGESVNSLVRRFWRSEQQSYRRGTMEL